MKKLTKFVVNLYMAEERSEKKKIGMTKMQWMPHVDES